MVSKEMHAYLRNNTKLVINLDPKEGEDRNEPTPQPSSRTKYKQAKKKKNSTFNEFICWFCTYKTSYSESEGVKVSELHAVQGT
jgi:hypothetical protein